jgi:hypothetical protein
MLCRSCFALGIEAHVVGFCSPYSTASALLLLFAFDAPFLATAHT